nr:MAG TPA: hypothetical protein [Caudoviricetes sp.]
MRYNKIKLNWCKSTSFFILLATAPTLLPIHDDLLLPQKTQKTLHPHGHSV